MTYLSGLFKGNYFNEPINCWAVSSITNIKSMFKEAWNFSQPLNNWNVSCVTDKSAKISWYYQIE